MKLLTTFVFLLTVLLANGQSNGDFIHSSRDSFYIELQYATIAYEDFFQKKSDSLFNVGATHFQNAQEILSRLTESQINTDDKDLYSQAIPKMLSLTASDIRTNEAKKGTEKMKLQVRGKDFFVTKNYGVPIFTFLEILRTNCQDALKLN